MFRASLLAICLMWSQLTIAAEPDESGPVRIDGFSNYVLLPSTAPGIKMNPVIMRSISDRMFGRVYPLLQEWSDPEKAAKDRPEISVALVIDKIKGTTGAGRLIWGGLAGSADLLAHVDLIERPSGKLVARQLFHSARGAWVAFELSTDYLAYDDLVNQVVAYLTGCYATRCEKMVDIETLVPPVVKKK